MSTEAPSLSGSLFTQTWPCVGCANRKAMANRNPVPPNRLMVVPSACSNG